MNTQKGSFTISLDFELFWGVRDKRTTDSYKNNLEGTIEVIPKLLDIFEQYNIHVTWATVGLLLEPLNTLSVTECKSSMFLRPYSQKLNLLEKLKINRIKNAMTQAAKENKNFHLWWHPHNFGINQTQNLQNLHNILLHYKYLNERYGMKSLNMRELITNG